MSGRCEDFPACGHGPAPHGDGGGCPDDEGRFDCVSCGSKMKRGNRSAICNDCLHARDTMTDGEREDADLRREEADLG